jgi:hypothetical protein
MWQLIESEFRYNWLNFGLFLASLVLAYLTIETFARRRSQI